MNIEDSKLQEMINEAAEKINYWKWDSFSISTNIPKTWQVEEEKEWDAKLDEKNQSVKNRMNSRLVAELEKASGKNYRPVGAKGRITLDLGSGKVSVEAEPIFIFGRYKKLEAGLSQSRWVCQKCEGDGCFKCDWKGKYYTSVEELIGDIFKTHAESKDYVLHASGREDVDVINVAGRPFVLEITKARNTAIDLEKVAGEINKEKRVEVTDLKFVKPGFVEVVTESHFEKEYEAEVEFSQVLDEEKLKKIMEFAGKTINQRTPKRVAHRRADLVRKRKVVSIEFLGSEDNVARFKIMTEAGTYIKELINGDNGRTEHSFASAAGCNANCKSLKVTKIYDEFLDFVLRKD